MRPYSTRRCMRVKVLQPRDSKLIVRPAVIADSDNLVSRNSGILVPCRDVDLPRVDDEGWDGHPSSADALDHRNPLLIA